MNKLRKIGLGAALAASAYPNQVNAEEPDVICNEEVITVIPLAETCEEVRAAVRTLVAFENVPFEKSNSFTTKRPGYEATLNSTPDDLWGELYVNAWNVPTGASRAVLYFETPEHQVKSTMLNRDLKTVIGANVLEANGESCQDDIQRLDDKMKQAYARAERKGS